MDAPKHAIITRGLKKAYKHTQVLEGVDMEVETGSIFCLLGSNGAGKTTMVRILSTLARADSGDAEICGHSVRRSPAKVREVISLTGQFAAVDETLTGRENLEFIAKLRGVRRARERAVELLREFGLSDAANTRSAAYSGGMRRRLDIAMSVVKTPDVLFLDEPTTGLDPQSRNTMWEMIRKLAEGGVTVFLTTQYLDEADRLADQIAVLHGGKIIAKGTPTQLRAMLPSRTVKFEFMDAVQCAHAQQALSRRQPAVSAEGLSLMVSCDGSMEELRDILGEVKDIEVLSVSQERATLEEVFLSLIDGNEGGMYNGT